MLRKSLTPVSQKARLITGPSCLPLGNTLSTDKKKPGAIWRREGVWEEIGCGITSEAHDAADGNNVGVIAIAFVFGELTPNAEAFGGVELRADAIGDTLDV